MQAVKVTKAVATYTLPMGVGVGAGTLASAFGPLAACTAGTSAFVGTGIALNLAIHEDVKAGDWAEFNNSFALSLTLLSSWS